MIDEGELFTRAQARLSGLTNRQLTTRLKSGAIQAPRRGVLRYPFSAGRTADVSPVLPVDVQAALLATPGRELVVSHVTAARLLGLPQPLAGWPDPQFTATSGPTRNRTGVQIKVAALGIEQVVQYAGIAITSAARTVADCLRTLPGRDALAVTDAAPHRGLVDAESVIEVLRQQAGWPGVGIGRQVVALADPRRESPLESWSAWAFAHTQVPRPEWQVELRESTGRLIGRADCWWARCWTKGQPSGWPEESRTPPSRPRTEPGSPASLLQRCSR